jgi:hypothetical protein
MQILVVLLFLLLAEHSIAYGTAPTQHTKVYLGEYLRRKAWWSEREIDGRPKEY